MEDRSHALIAIGFLIVLGIGALLVIWWVVTPGATRVPYILVAKSSVAGLGQGSDVQFNGVKVGIVKSVRIDKKTHRSILVKALIDKKFPIPKGSYATAGSASLVGATVVTIHLGKGPGTLHTSQQNPAHLKVHQGGISALLSEASGIMSKAKATLDTVNSAVQHIASQKNVKQISDTLKNIHQASAKLVALEKDLAPAAKQAPALIAQTRATMRKAHQLAANANKLVVSARAPLSAVGQAAGSAKSFTAQLNHETIPQLNATLIQLRALSKRLNALVEELKRSPQSLILGPAKPRLGPGESGGGSGGA
jgi:phospholipid/cholesterol/gamma-HCH transport system substrate-binding protein